MCSLSNGAQRGEQGNKMTRQIVSSTRCDSQCLGNQWSAYLIVTVIDLSPSFFALWANWNKANASYKSFGFYFYQQNLMSTGGL
jgi:hypothetical protein